jgi:hypothetical protein
MTAIPANGRLRFLPPQVAGTAFHVTVPGVLLAVILSRMTTGDTGILFVTAEGQRTG